MISLVKCVWRNPRTSRREWRRAWARGTSLPRRPSLPQRIESSRPAEEPAGWRDDARQTRPDDSWSVNAPVLERERILRGWTPAHLARVAHVDPRTVRSLVASRRRPSLGTVQAVCVALGLQLTDVIVFPTRVSEP